MKLLEARVRFLWWPKFCGRKGKIDLWLCHFLNQTALVNQQKRGEIKTLKIFKPGQERASFKNTEEPQNHRASLTLGEHLCRGSFTQFGRRGRNATVLRPPPKQTQALPDPTRTASH